MTEQPFDLGRSDELFRDDLQADQLRLIEYIKENSIHGNSAFYTTSPVTQDQHLERPKITLNQ